MFKTRQTLSDNKFDQSSGNTLTLLGTNNISTVKGSPTLSIVSNGLTFSEDPDTLAAGAYDSTLKLGGGFNNAVTFAIELGDKIIAGGSFTRYESDSSLGFITSLNQDTTLDSSFNVGVGFSHATTNAIIDDDKLVIFGSYNAFSGITTNRIVRLNSNGSRDTSFLIGTGFNSVVNDIIKQEDGKYLLVGAFTSYSGITGINRMLRLHSNGTLDTTFTVGSGFSSTPTELAIQTDGKIIVGGTFTTFSGVTTNRIVRLNTDGSRDTSFIIGTGFGGSVSDLVIQDDGKIVVIGSFTTYSGITGINRIARLHPNGTLDTTFNSGTGFITNPTCLFIDSNQKILIGGQFTQYNDVTVDRIIRLNSDGSHDTTFTPNFTTQSGAVLSISQTTNGDYLVSGSILITKDDNKYKFIARLNQTGVLRDDFKIENSGFSSGIINKVVNQDNKILLGGSFGSYNDISSTNRFIRLLSDGTLDETFNNSAPNSDINDIEILSDGKILVGGSFTQFDGNANKLSLVKTDSNGFLDDSFIVPGSGLGFDGDVDVISLYDNGKIIVAGAFTTYSGQTAHNVIRLNSDGTIDDSFSSQDLLDTANGGDTFEDYYFVNSFENIHILSNGDIILVGILDILFDSGTSYASGVIALTSGGTLHPTFGLTGGGTRLTYINDLANITSIKQDDDKIVIGGSFTDFNNLVANSGYTINRILRINPDGSFDTSFNMGSGFNGRVSKLELDPDGNILVQGQFTQYKDVECPNFIKLDSNGNLLNSLNAGSGFDTTINSIAFFDDKIVIGGSFQTYDNNLSTNLVRLQSDAQGYRINSPNGLNYTSDISANLTDLTLVHKKYVVDQFSLASRTFNNGLALSGQTVSLGGTLNSNVLLNLSTFDLNFTGTTGNVLLKGRNVSLIGSSSNGIERTKLTLTHTGATFTDTTTGETKGIVYGGNYLAGLSSNSLIPKQFITNLFTTSNGLTLSTGDTANLGGILYDDVLLSGSTQEFKLKTNTIKLTTDDNSLITYKNSKGEIFENYKFNEYFDQTVYDVLELNDGKRFFAGAFHHYNGEACTYLVKVNPDETIDNTFNSGGTGFVKFSSNYIDSLYLTNNNKLIVVGSVFGYNGSNSSYAIELTTGGTVSQTFDFEGGTVHRFVEQEDGKYIFIGYFSSYSGVTSRGIVRLNPNGTIDNTFNTGAGFSWSAGAGGAIDIGIQSDGKIVVAGIFQSYNNVDIFGLVRLNTDGSIDNTFFGGSTGFSFGGTYSMYLYPDGSMLVGGQFSEFNGIDLQEHFNIGGQMHLLKLTSGGTLYSGFTGTSNFALISKIDIQSDGKILVHNNQSIRRYNENGTLDSSFRSLSSNVTGFRLLEDDSIYLFPKLIYDDIPVKYVAKLDPDGNIIDSFFKVTKTSALHQSGGEVNHLATINDKVLLFGSFSMYDTQSGMTNLIRINRDRTLDFVYPSFTSTGNPEIGKMLVTSDNKLLIIGSFTKYNEVSRNGIVRINYDGSIDDTFNIGDGFDIFSNSDYPRDIGVQVDGKYVVVGDFLEYSGVTCNGIIRLNPNGTIDNTFNSGGTGFTISSSFYPQAVKIQADGKIVVGGNFKKYNNADVNALIRLNSDGSIDSSFNSSPTGFTGQHTVQAIEIQPDGKILLGGAFNFFGNYNGNNVTNKVFRINNDGSFDSTFQLISSFNSINKIKYINDKIFVCASFSHFRVLNLDGTEDLSFTFPTERLNYGGSQSSATYDIIWYDDSLYIGGSFIRYGDDFVTSFVRVKAFSEVIIDNPVPFEYQNDVSSHLKARSIPDVHYVTGHTIQVKNEIGLEIVTGSSFTASTSSHFIHVSATTAVNVWLPASPKFKQQIFISDAKGNASSNNITINGNSKSINGVSTSLIDTNYGSLMFVYNGINWIGGSMLG